MFNTKKSIYVVILFGFIAGALSSSLQTEVGMIIQGMIMLITFLAVYKLSKIIEGKRILKKILKYVSILFIFVSIFMIIDIIFKIIF